MSVLNQRLIRLLLWEAGCVLAVAGSITLAEPRLGGAVAIGGAAFWIPKAISSFNVLRRLGKSDAMAVFVSVLFASISKMVITGAVLAIALSQLPGLPGQVVFFTLAVAYVADLVLTGFIVQRPLWR